MSHERVLFEIGTLKEGYVRSDVPIGDELLVPGVAYEVVFQAGTTRLPNGWGSGAHADLIERLLPPTDSPFYGVVTVKCRLTYIRVDELVEDDDTTVLGRTVTVQFEYLGSTDGKQGLIRNVIRRISDWGDIYTLQMQEPTTMSVMAADTTSPILVLAGIGVLGAALFFVLG